MTLLKCPCGHTTEFNPPYQGGTNKIVCSNCNKINTHQFMGSFEDAFTKAFNNAKKRGTKY